ncbi:MAG: hypothetical protein FWC26_00505 [Fibromonadales bacterium]|nr:hypothetical protein [Fibromonadales bacterium]
MIIWWLFQSETAPPEFKGLQLAVAKIKLLMQVAKQKESKFFVKMIMLESLKFQRLYTEPFFSNYRIKMV